MRRTVSCVCSPAAACGCVADIVPSLNENRILKRWAGGVRLLQVCDCQAAACRLQREWLLTRLFVEQVAAQELAWGIKFSATATLDIEELPNGIASAQRDGCVACGTPASCSASPARCLSRGPRKGGARKVVPRSPGPPPLGVRDICFTLVESRDLKYFSGTWRIETRDASQARLIYTVEVLPQPWLPVCTSRETRVARRAHHVDDVLTSGHAAAPSAHREPCEQRLARQLGGRARPRGGAGASGRAAAEAAGAAQRGTPAWQRRRRVTLPERAGFLWHQRRLPLIHSGV